MERHCPPCGVAWDERAPLETARCFLCGTIGVIGRLPSPGSTQDPYATHYLDQLQPGELEAIA